jgi:hypothetical protein
MAWMIVGVCAAIIFAAISGGSSSGSGGSNAHSTATRATHCGIGDVRAVHDRKFGAIVAGSSKKALDDFGSAAVAHDTEGLDQMMNSGKLMELPNGDRLRILDFQGFLAQTTKARVLTDPDPNIRGQVVWIDGCSGLGPKLG